MTTHIHAIHDFGFTWNIIFWHCWFTLTYKCICIFSGKIWNCPHRLYRGMEELILEKTRSWKSYDSLPLISFFISVDETQSHLSCVDSQVLSKTVGSDSQNNHKNLDSQPESQSQLSYGESQDLYGTAEDESQNSQQYLDSPPESQSLFVKYKSELAAIKGKDKQFCGSHFRHLNFFKYSVRHLLLKFPLGSV